MNNADSDDLFYFTHNYTIFESAKSIAKQYLIVFGNGRSVSFSAFDIFEHNMHRRLLTTAATTPKFSIAPSTIPRFPPKEAHSPIKDAFEREAFDPAAWASLQPPPATALSAFAHRIGLGSIFSTPDVIRQACTHDSYLRLFRKHYPGKQEPLTNRQLAALGNALMGMFAVEWVHAKWPYLPTRVMKSVVTAHVGPATCESVSREMGAAPLLRWHRTVGRPGNLSFWLVLKTALCFFFFLNSLHLRLNSLFSMLMHWLLSLAR